MEVSGQIRAPAALPPLESAPIPFGQVLPEIKKILLMRALLTAMFTQVKYSLAVGLILLETVNRGSRAGIAQSVQGLDKK
jgi:hypothetical protein